MSPVSPALQVDHLPLVPSEKPCLKAQGFILNKANTPIDRSRVWGNTVKRRGDPGQPMAKQCAKNNQFAYNMTALPSS